MRIKKRKKNEEVNVIHLFSFSSLTVLSAITTSSTKYTGAFSGITSSINVLQEHSLTLR
jgi:hypothetical protein